MFLNLSQMEIARALIFIMWANYVADFLLQSKKMSNNKHHSVSWLLVHIAAYTTSFAFFLWIFNLLVQAFTWENMLLLVGINGISHFIIDFITSKISAYYYKANKYKTFIKIIGMDQFIHVTILIILTFWFITI